MCSVQSLQGFEPDTVSCPERRSESCEQCGLKQCFVPVQGSLQGSTVGASELVSAAGAVPAGCDVGQVGGGGHQVGVERVQTDGLHQAGKGALPPLRLLLRAQVGALQGLRKQVTCSKSRTLSVQAS